MKVETSLRTFHEILSENGSDAPSLHDETTDANSIALLRLFSKEKISMIFLIIINVRLE